MGKPKIDYTSRDWAALGASLEEYIRARFPNWTDFAAGNVGNVFKELVQYVGDGLHYTLDFRVSELFPDSATERESALSIAGMLDYEPQPRITSLVNLTISLERNAMADVVVPRGTRAWTDGIEPLCFETQEDLLIPAGLWYGSVVAKQVQTIRDTVEVAPQAWLSLPLSQTPFLAPGDTEHHGAMTVLVNGEEWQRLDSLLEAIGGQQVYEVTVDSDDRGWVLFGDSVSGAIPAGLVEILYEIGGGLQANVPPNSITMLDSALVDMRGTPVGAYCRNALGAWGGEDAESTERILRRAPRANRSPKRTVHLEDFVTHAELVPGVARAKAAARPQDKSIPLNTTRVYIVPAGGGDPSEEVLTQVRVMLTDDRPVMASHEVEVVGAIYAACEVVGSLRVKAGYDPVEVQEAAEQAVWEAFDYLAVDEDTGELRLEWGKPIYLSEIIEIIMAVEGVRSVTLTVPDGDLRPDEWAILALESVTLAVADI